MPSSNEDRWSCEMMVDTMPVDFSVTRRGDDFDMSRFYGLESMRTQMVKEQEDSQ
jgi:hypothetical protein